MKIFWLIILPMILCTWPESTTAEVESLEFPFHIFFPIVRKIIKAVISVAAKCFKSNPIPHESTSFSDVEKRVFADIITISQQITNLEHTVIETSNTTVTKLLHAFPKIIKLELNMHELKLIINQINYADEQMQHYLALGYNKIKLNQTTVKPFLATNQNISQGGIINENSTTEVSNTTIDKTIEQSNTSTITTTTFPTSTREAVIDLRIERYTLENFAKWATDHSFNSLKSLVRRLNDLILTKNDDSLFDLILQVSKDKPNNICTLKQSLHQTLYNLYNEVMMAELKGNTILQFSYMILHMYDKGTFSDESNLALHDYQRYAKQKREVIAKALSMADRALYKCDPDKYIDGVTYTKLTRLLTGYIENEKNINRRHSCWKKCRNYKNTRHYGCRKKHKLCSRQPPCKGRIVNCRSLSRKIKVCLSSAKDRRYDWIRNGKTTVWGRDGRVCTKNIFRGKAWFSWFFSRCTYCVCFCDDVGSHSDRYFNLREITSDIDQNKVVTGLRIVKKNQIIHIQIQQGVLASQGFINRTSLAWKPVDNYTIHDLNVKNNVDYYTMSFTRRIIDTNEMVGPSEHVVTGLRFREAGTHLKLEARVTPINFTLGELYQNKSYWLRYYKNGINEKYGINEIELIRPDVPTRRGPHYLFSQYYEYIKFQPTDLKYDMGQSTVPYLDSQELTSDGFALSGIGLIHRGKWHSGGFIAPKLISYDFTPHLSLIKTN